ncbi:hypothetical protein RB595_002805 [Gaeumannomyces hyphopodioides]
MSERKVLSKYYPADFDPNALTRRRGPKQKGPKVQVVRLMAPFGMRCTSCGEYIYRGRKFNARKETNPEERYLGIQIHRFYIKCTRCSTQISFRTDPANQDYVCERGAKRNTDPWKRGLGDGADGAPDDETDEARLDRLEQEHAEEEERNAMAELEAKTVDAKREMAVADALDELRTRNARIARADPADAEALVAEDRDEERLRQDAEDAEAARKAFAWARDQATDMQEELIAEEDMVGWDGGALKSASTSASLSDKPAASTTTTTNPAPANATDMPPPSFKRQVKKKTDRAALLGIKKKT